MRARGRKPEVRHGESVLWRIRGQRSALLIALGQEGIARDLVSATRRNELRLSVSLIFLSLFGAAP